MLIIKRPLGHHHQERQRRASKADVQCQVDVLGEEADEESDCAGEREEAVGDVLGEALAGEVLPGGQSGGFGRVWGMGGSTISPS